MTELEQEQADKIARLLTLISEYRIQVGALKAQNSSQLREIERLSGGREAGHNSK